MAFCLTLGLIFALITLSLGAERTQCSDGSCIDGGFSEQEVDGETSLLTLRQAPCNRTRHLTSLPPTKFATADGAVVKTFRFKNNAAQTVYLKVIKCDRGGSSCTPGDHPLDPGAQYDFTLETFSKDGILPVPDDNRLRIQASFAPTVTAHGRPQYIDQWVEISKPLSNSFTYPSGNAWNFANQNGYTDLNMGVKFLKADAKTPICDQPIAGPTSSGDHPQNPMSGFGFSDFRTNFKTSECETVASGGHQQVAKKITYPILNPDGTDTGKTFDVCLPACAGKTDPSKKGQSFDELTKKNLFDDNKYEDLVNCEPCVISNAYVADATKQGPVGPHANVVFNAFAKYISDHTIVTVHDGHATVMMSQTRTVTSTEDLWPDGVTYRGGNGAREWNDQAGTRLPVWSPTDPVHGETVTALSANFECWDKAGAGSQGVGPNFWPSSCKDYVTNNGLGFVYVEFTDDKKGYTDTGPISADQVMYGIDYVRAKTGGWPVNHQPTVGGLNPAQPEGGYPQ